MSENIKKLLDDTFESFNKKNNTGFHIEGFDRHKYQTLLETYTEKLIEYGYISIPKD